MSATILSGWTTKVIAGDACWIPATVVDHGITDFADLMGGEGKPGQGGVVVQLTQPVSDKVLAALEADASCIVLTSDAKPHTEEISTKDHTDLTAKLSEMKLPQADIDSIAGKVEAGKALPTRGDVVKALVENLRADGKVEPDVKPDVKPVPKPVKADNFVASVDVKPN